MTGPLDRVTSSLPAPWDTIVDWVVTIAIAVAAVLAIKTWVVNPYRIPSSSMEPTLHCAEPAAGCQAGSSDRVLANRFIYRFRDPSRGDIVVFDTPERAVRRCGAGGTFVKRLVGLPGERISSVQGIVYIDGEPLDEPYVNGGPPGPDFRERVLGADEYFMLGDNRGQSCDSRKWGPVTREDLIGPVFAIYWPLTRLGLY
ncbi:MAG TPA: signal peptidase I [Gaiellaceae bacterium]|nr:signal peptidase I [Gaiellaceae bacterium]